jgi:periplasmic divalent cation tolerance protein
MRLARVRARPRADWAGSCAVTTPDYVIVLTTVPADADGRALARTLVGERLAACVNLLAPMDSVFRWEGQVEEEREQQLVMKTSHTRVAALWDRLRELHPYEVPEFLVVPILDGSDAYLRWVGESTAAK